MSENDVLLYDQSRCTSIACLPMYDMEEIQWANDALWTALAKQLRTAGLQSVPEKLTRSESLEILWHHPGLLLGHTCGYPLVTALREQVQVVATPIYRAPGCKGAWHRSAIIVAATNHATGLRDLKGQRCALNSYDSNSGMNLLRAAIAPLADHSRFFSSVIESGSHRQSLRMVAGGDADIAAIDCVTLEHLRRFDPAQVAAVRILGLSPAAPSLPLITAVSASEATVNALRLALDAITVDPDLVTVRAALLIEGFEVLPQDAYQHIAMLEAQAKAVSYPILV